ncbi:hypothetical protein PU345_004316 [Enterobacter kobei]|nr:hypothetical protein [Enterobacter kobei]
MAAECQFQASQPVLDYGTLNPDVLRYNGGRPTQVSLGKRSVQLNAVCTTPQDMVVRFVGTVAGNGSWTPGDEGGMLLTVTSARVDGVSVLVRILSASGEQGPVHTGGLRLLPGESVMAVDTTGAAVGGVSLNLEFSVDPWITEKQLKVRDEMLLEWRGTFELQ